MVAFAFGAGFFNAASKERDRIKAEEADMKKMMWQNWQNNTLPQIRKARETDDLAVSKMNEYISDPRLQGQPELAYFAVKSVLSGEYRNKDEFISQYEKDSTIVPPEVRQRQLEALNKSFSYNVDPATGKVSNFSLKRTPTTVEPAPRRTLSQILSGRKTTQQLEQEAAGSMPGESVYQPTTSQFMAAPTSGTVTGTPVDKEKQKSRDMALEVAARSNMIKNMPKFLEALNQGPEAAVKYVSTPGAFYSKEELESKEFNAQIQQTLLKDALEFGTKDEGFKMLVSGRLSGEQLAAYMQNNMKTPEEKANWSMEQLRKKGVMNPSGTLDWVRVINDPEAFALAVPNAESRPIVKASIEKAIAQQAMTTLARNMSMFGGIEGAVMPGVESMPPVQVPQVVPQSMEEESAAAQPAGGIVIGQVPEPKEETVQRVPRLGEDPNTGAFMSSPELDAAIVRGDVNSVRQSNPFSVMSSVARGTKGDITKVARSITFRRSDLDRLRDPEVASKYGQIFDEILVPQLKQYKSIAEALEDGAQPGNVVRIGDKYVIITPDQ